MLLKKKSVCISFLITRTMIYYYRANLLLCCIRWQLDNLIFKYVNMSGGGEESIIISKRTCAPNVNCYIGTNKTCEI